MKTNNKEIPNVGDKVVLIKPSYSFDKIGDIITIYKISTELVEGSTYNSKISSLLIRNWIWHKSQVRPLTKLDKILD